jgi:hypothetical protein
MRITEIADAVEQLALWKLINTSVWTAIDTQAKQQAQQRAASQQQRKAKRPRSKSRSVSVPHVPMPPKQHSLLPNPKHLQKTTNPSTQPTQPTQKSAYPHTQQALPSRHPSNKTADVASAIANPTSTLPTSQATHAHPSSVQQPHATQASHTLVPQLPIALPLQKRLSAQKKRV